MADLKKIETRLAQPPRKYKSPFIHQHPQSFNNVQPGALMLFKEGGVETMEGVDQCSEGCRQDSIFKEMNFFDWFFS